MSDVLPAPKNAWKARATFIAIVLVSTIVSIILVHLFQTPSIMVVNAIPIILSGWFFGRRYALLAALLLFVVTGAYFKLAHLNALVDPKGLFLGIVSFGIFSAAGYALRSVRDLYDKIHKLNEAINDKNRELREAVLKDPLTDLHNRRYVDECIAGLATTFLRQISTPEFAMRNLGMDDKVILLMIADIDHFKRINDGFGHGAGDAALIEVSRRIKDSVRFDDTVIRWGGEEFLVVCPMVNKANAQAVIRKVLDGVRTEPVVLPDGTELPVTISLGAIWIPVFRDHPFAVSFDKAITVADKALYDAKAKGRNHARLVVAHQDAIAKHGGKVPESPEMFYGNEDCCTIVLVGADLIGSGSGGADWTESVNLESDVLEQVDPPAVGP
ncbi:MAG: hypothetical protein RL173_745 [Fibrobacterota bacterium]|jgi:diguanylate cyclase (GGDEF)-like protein